MRWVSVQFKGKEVWAEVDDGGPGEVAFGHHFIEHPQQIQIQRAEIDR